jgi:predicted RNase H-like HicB family nuclease
MKEFQTLKMVIDKEDGVYVAICREVDIASQGESVDEAKSNLMEAIELFFDHTSKNEIESRLKK